MSTQSANYETQLAAVLPRLVPLNNLPQSALRTLAERLKPQPFAAEKELPLATLSKQLYLLQGRVAVLMGGKTVAKVEGGSREACLALNRTPNPQLAIRTETPCIFLLVDAALVAQAAKTTAAVAAKPTAAQGKFPPWLQHLLQKPIFRRIPSRNLRKVLDSVEVLETERGEQLLQQGKFDDHYYIIQKGHCSVIRHKESNIQRIDGLSSGDSFGAITLLSQHPSFVTTVADQPGQILRLNKDDFHTWVFNPLEKAVDYRQAVQLAQKRGAIWLDVRCAEEYQAGHIPNSLHLPLQHLHIPFTSLIKLVRGLDDQRPYLVYSNTQKRANAAAFRFLEQNLNVMTLKGGIHDIPGEQMTSLPTAALLRRQKEAELRQAQQAAQARQAKIAAATAAHNPQEAARKAELLRKAQEEIARIKHQKALHAAEQAIQTAQSKSRAMETQSHTMHTPPPAREAEVEAMVAENDDDADFQRARRRGPMRMAMAALALLTAVGGFFAFYWNNDSQPEAAAQAAPSVLQPPQEDSPADSQPTAKFQAIRIFQDPLKIKGTKAKAFTGPEMVELPAGSFLMGSSPQRPFFDEHPQFLINLQGFAISKYEITFEQYAMYAQATSRALPDDRHWGKGKQPVINVTWQEAKQYAQWLSEQTGHNYRLPSEREWEYAASAGINALYWWGNAMKLEPPHANCADCGTSWSSKQPAPVGSLLPNPLGLYDMLGNVMEWTEDCMRQSYQDAPQTGNVWPGGNCAWRMARGGSYRRYSAEIRMTKRTKLPPEARSDELGFRVVRVE